MRIVKEPSNRDTFIELDHEWEDRVCDIAIESLSDIAECDEAVVYVRWQDFPPNGVVPFLYILFNKVSGALEKMQRLHIDYNGKLRPSHAILLVTLPSKKVMPDIKLRYVIRKGVEDFLRTYDVKKGD